MSSSATKDGASIVPPDEVLKATLWDYAKQGIKLTKRIEKLKEDHGLTITPAELIKLNSKFQVPKEQQDALSEDEIFMLVHEKLDILGSWDKLPAVPEVQKLLTEDNHLIPREAVLKAMKAVKQARELRQADGATPTGLEPSTSTQETTPVVDVTMAPSEAHPDAQLQPSSDLVQLLDVSSLATHEELASRFDDIARSLLLNHHLELTIASGTEEYEILEAEFYLQKPDCHQDPFTHGAEEQRHTGRWYFHRAPMYNGGVSKTSYRDGSRKGLDLTFGGLITSPALDSEPVEGETRGGILLRSLLRRSDSKVICGPSLLADEVITRSGAEGIKELVQNLWAGDTSAFLPCGSRTVQLSVRQNKEPGSASKSEHPLYSSPRVGLDLSNPSVTADLAHPRVIYLPKAYRYYTRPKLFGDKARSHTFLGVYKSLCLSDPKVTETALAGKIAQVMGMKTELVTKYMGHFHAYGAGDMGALKPFVGKAGKGTSNSPAAFLGMMGILITGPRPVKGKQNNLMAMFGAKGAKK